MKVCFQRGEKYPGVELDITVHEAWRYKNTTGRVMLEARGNLSGRDKIRDDFEAWLKTKRLKSKSRRYGARDMH